MREKNLIKLIKTIDLLGRHNGATIQELEEGLGIDRRSVYRAIKVVEELDIPVYDDKDPLEKSKRWKIEESYLKRLPNHLLPELNLTLSEIISLYLLKSEGRIYRNTDIGRKMDSAFNKIGLASSDGLASKLDKIKSLFTLTSKFTKDYSGKEKVIDTLTRAMLEQKRCAVKYHSFGTDTKKEFEIDPLSFFDNNGGLYLFVNTPACGNIRILAVERIEKISVTDASFEYPEGFNPEERLNSAFDIVYDDPIDVKVWFSAAQARYVKERRWAKGQRIKEQADGSIILSMKTSGSWDVKKWVLSYGPDAKVLEPAKLRDEVIKDIEAARKGYDG
ncbi:MAG: WYL domain-containing protein [Deltaproteobacteria bacterium]|nr:WYL domain-containing protein [Deltaproteobacteria bacterium]